MLNWEVSESRVVEWEIRDRKHKKANKSLEALGASGEQEPQSYPRPWGEGGEVSIPTPVVIPHFLPTVWVGKGDSGGQRKPPGRETKVGAGVKLAH